MAAAALERLVTCDICFEVFEDPQLLACIHVFCKKCVDRLASGSVIQCPMCKEECPLSKVKSDFRTKALVESYNQENEQSLYEIPEFTPDDGCNSSDTTKKLCDNCSDENQPVLCICQECNSIMCQECQMLHRDDDYYKTHTIKSIVSCAAEIKNQLNKYEKELNELKMLAESKKATGSEELNRLNKKESEIIKQIDVKEAELIAKIKNHHGDLKKKVKQDVERSRRTIKSSQQSYSLMSFKVDSQISMSKDLLDSKSDLELMEMGMNVAQDISQTIAKIKKEAEACQMKEELNLSVETDSNFDVSKCTSLRSSQPSPCKPDTQIDYSSLKTDYKLHTTVDQKQKFNEHIYTMYLQDDFLYCTTHNSLYIFSKTLQLIRSVKFEGCNHSYPISLETPDGFFIVGCDRGLNIHDTNGKLIYVIHPGQFSSVYVKDQQICAYNWGEKKLQWFVQKSESKWEIVKAVHFNLQNTSYEDRLYMQGDNIYISSFNGSCVNKYNCAGSLIYSYTGNGKLIKPYLCGVDRRENMLVVYNDDDHYPHVSVINNTDECKNVLLRGLHVSGKVCSVVMEGDHGWAAYQYNNYTNSGVNTLSMYKAVELPKTLQLK